MMYPDNITSPPPTWLLVLIALVAIGGFIWIAAL